MTVPSDADLQAAMRDLDRSRVASHISAATGMTSDEAAAQLDKYLNESLVALRLITPHLAERRRALEVGSGTGYLSRFLHSQQFDVVELEPVGPGFEFMAAARDALREALGPGPTHLPIGVDELDPETHGTFDVVYSLNVLEHVPDWRSALDSTLAVLAPGGTIVQSCPNYTFPYEPHFGIPLIPARPWLTARVLPRSIHDSGLWQSLNWVTQAGVQGWAADRGVNVEFEHGRLADALARLSNDPEFARRHGKPICLAASAMDRVGLIELIRRIPPKWTTPMTFTVTRSS